MGVERFAHCYTQCWALLTGAMPLQARYVEVSPTGQKGPARWGCVAGPRGCDLGFPWSTHLRMLTATTGPGSQGGGIKLENSGP